MKETKNHIAIDIDKLKLLQVKVFKAYQEANESFRDDPKPVHEFAIETATKTAFNFQKKLCRFRLFLKFSAIDTDKNQLGLEAEYGIDFHYMIENLNDFLVHTEGNEVQVDSVLGSNLCAISYSTARGMIFERMRGTYLDGVILPIVDPSKLLQNES